MNINGDLQSTYNPTQSMCYTANITVDNILTTLNKLYIYKSTMHYV